MELELIARRIIDQVSQTATVTWLQDQRWYADKGRKIVAVRPIDVRIERVNEDFLALCVATVKFLTGEPSAYFLPLALSESARMPGIDLPNEFLPTASLVDATGLDWFGDWFLGSLTAESSRDVQSWAFGASDAGISTIQHARGRASRRLESEQTNTSVLVGEEAVVKIIRRLQPGPNPEMEATRALSTMHFPHVPEFIGSASWISPDNVEYTIAMAQRFVPNHGDGWSWMQRRLIRDRAIDGEASGPTFEPEKTLGARTAELHCSLGAVKSPDFLPLAPDAGTARGNIQRTLSHLEDVTALLTERASTLPASMQRRLPEIVAGLGDKASWANGFHEEAACLRVRVHGDYHLGQVLRTLDDDWSIIDFEGEPARPAIERRQRTSVLKDVAGMLRSFSYARGYAETSVSIDDMDSRARLAAWELGARSAFLDGYRNAMPATERLVPLDSAAFTRALRAWELDKALYEISYEIRNRPSWVSLPLGALLPELPDQLGGPAGVDPA